MLFLIFLVFHTKLMGFFTSISEILGEFLHMALSARRFWERFPTKNHDFHKKSKENQKKQNVTSLDFISNLLKKKLFLNAVNDAGSLMD